MNLFVLDDDLSYKAIVEEFKSLIWVEKWREKGYFELWVTPTLSMQALLAAGTKLSLSASHRIMIVEDSGIEKDDDGRAYLKVIGASMERILEDRVAKSNLALPYSLSAWDINDQPADAARTMFTSICVDGDLSAADILPFYVPGTSFFPTDSIPEPTDSYNFSFAVDSLYNNIKWIADNFALGFRLYLIPNLYGYSPAELHFDIYAGTDRTLQQTSRRAVVFSVELDNISNERDFVSTSKVKNVAYVYAVNGYRYVYANGGGFASTGFDRRIIPVDAGDITTAAGSTLQAQLEQRGQEALAKYQPLMTFDGEASKLGSYIYDQHYYLGDLVTKVTSLNVSLDMRVTEQTFMIDEEGERSYPTLTTENIVTPGSWQDWDPDEEWEDVLGTWDSI